MKQNKAFFAFLIIFSVVFTQNSFSQTYNFNLSGIFNEKLSDAEKNDLLNGKIVYKNIGKAQNISLIDTNDVLSSIKELKPNYLAEIIQIIPISKTPFLIFNLYQILNDIPSYKGIPYYSEHNGIWVDLYSEAKILSKKESNENAGSTSEIDKTKINAEFFMDPFGTIISEITILQPEQIEKGKYFSENFLIYENINTSTITYHDFNCVKPEKMKSMIYVFQKDGYFILYGIGGLNAPKVPFLSSRIELSFMNRIKTFCNFVFTKLNK
ncbi:MAG: hypothetical protein KBT21_11150 [Treponema sp.]|nr:hypothetical protein [Candidatus Treponema merdequi]